MKEKCLNCYTELRGKYCHECGQDSLTKRLNGYYIFMHDLLNGIVNPKKGFYHTIYNLMIMPGITVREYIAGRRMTYMNYYSFFGLAIVLFTLAEGLTDFSYSKLIEPESESLLLIDHLLKNYTKTFYTLIIPIQSIITFMLFTKAKLNYWEHLVANTYRISIVLMINALFVSVSVFFSRETLVQIEKFITLLSSVYSIWFYYQSFQNEYNGKVFLVFRSILSLILPILLLSLSLLVFLQN